MGGKGEMSKKGMEQWVPLFEIFLNSHSPETEASLWFQQHTPSTSPASFLSFLLQTLTLTLTQTQTQTQPIIFLQTLPPFVQSRILSFLAYDSPLFPRTHLLSLASRVLASDRAPGDFWLRRAASNLLDEMPQLQREHDFYSIPEWLPNSTTTTTTLLPWLPLHPKQFEPTKPSSEESPDVVVVVMHEEEEIQEKVESCSPPPSPLDPLAIDEAIKLKVALSNSDSTSQTLRIARQLRNICLPAKAGRRHALLELIQPWEAEDEMLSVLLSGLCNDDDTTGKGDATDWPTHVLCSVSLPPFLTLASPASRVLLSATISFCKLHPVAAVEALVFPLALSGKGINAAVCDVLARVVKECLHPVHVSAFCRRLLCGKDKGRRVVCLPCHRGLVSDTVVWTESMFTLFQQILNLGVYFTPDTTHQLVLVIDKVAEKFSRSLKFGNFLLCFVTKCVHAVEIHKALLESAAKKTDTFVTKSILSKLEVH